MTGLLQLTMHLDFPMGMFYQIFVYCVNVKNKTIYKLIIAVTDASMIYREKAPKLNLLYSTVTKDP